MPDPQTQNKGLYTPAHNADVDTWDQPLNANWNALDSALGGSTTLNATSLSGDQALTSTQYGPLTLIITGTPSAAITYVIPSGVGGMWCVSNNTSGGQTVGIKSAAGGSTVIIPAGVTVFASCNGAARGMVIAAGPAAGANTQVQYNASGSLAGSANFTFDGNTASVNALLATTATIGTLTVTALAAGSPLTGCMFWFPAPLARIPSVALACYGQAVSRTTYAALFAVIGTTWGEGDGSTTFNLPDMRGRVPAGADNEGGTPANRLGNGNTGGFTGAATLGTTGGEQSHTLTTTEMPAHAHNAVQAPTASGSGSNATQWVNAIGGAATPTGSTGGDVPHNNVQPTIVGNWIIFT